MRLRTNSQYLAQSKQNVHKYNQKYFYYLPNKLCSLSQNEFERIIFNEVILLEIFNKNQSKYLLQAFRKVLKMIYYSVYFEQNWTQCWPAGQAWNPIRLCEAKNNLVLRRESHCHSSPKYFPYLELLGKIFLNRYTEEQLGHMKTF